MEGILATKALCSAFMISPVFKKCDGVQSPVCKENGCHLPKHERDTVDQGEDRVETGIVSSVLVCLNYCYLLATALICMSISL